MWSSIINGGLLIFSSVMILWVADWVYSIHQRWFQITREQFNMAIYGYLGLYKIFWLIFNLTPYIALLIIA
jgi:hypothetical protein